VYHTQQNPRLVEHQDATQYVPKKLGDGKTYYVEEVNGPLVFRISVGAKQVYQNTLAGFARDYGTLCDRNYRITRTGKSLDTVYTINPLKETPIPDAIKQLVLPDLGDVITGKIKSFDQQDEAVKESDPTTELFGSEPTSPMDEKSIF
jgi:hypothetical protein